MSNYYQAYDSLYKSLYAQGFEKFSTGPRVADNYRAFAEYIDHCTCEADIKRMLEVGCGEGVFTKYLFERLATIERYLGIDYSMVAIEKARIENVAIERAEFTQCDILQFKSENEFDCIVDVACFHMMITDTDRKNFLHRILDVVGRTGKYIMLNQYVEQTRYDDISTVEMWSKLKGYGNSSKKWWEVWDTNTENWSPVELPIFHCRGNTVNGYVREFENAGFKVNDITQKGTNLMCAALEKGR